MKREPKRWFVVIGVIGTTIVALSVGLGAAVASGGPPDFAVGSASAPYPTAVGPGFARISVSAHSDPSGLDPRGHVHARGTTTGSPNGEFEVGGPVTCLRVEGNKAAIKYRFSQASGGAAPFKGGGVEIFIEDNGPPSHGQPVDEVASDFPQTAQVFNFDGNASQCDDPNLANYEKVTSGNYTVRDSDPGSADGRQP